MGEQSKETQQDGGVCIWPRALPPGGAFSVESGASLADLSPGHSWTCPCPNSPGKSSPYPSLAFVSPGHPRPKGSPYKHPHLWLTGHVLSTGLLQEVLNPTLLGCSVSHGVLQPSSAYTLWVLNY